jgi:hypothetical protein
MGKLTLDDIKGQCRDAADAEWRECRTGIRGGYLYSRGRFLSVIAAGECVLGVGEDWPWRGTMADIRAVLHKAIRQGHKPDLLSISGGFDWAESPRARMDRDYDPLVGDWAIYLDARAFLPDAAPDLVESLRGCVTALESAGADGGPGDMPAPELDRARQLLARLGAQ